MTAYESLRFEVPEEHIAVVTLARPERLNALDGPMLLELLHAVERIDADDAIRVWLLTGAPRPDGRGCFSAGVDVGCFADGRDAGLERGLELTNAIDDLLTPSIAVIDGVCTTGAAELALACDFRVAAESARISDWHLKHLGTGLGAWGGSTRWGRLVGTTHAKEVILLGKELGGAEAQRIGFASAVFAGDALLDGALAMARTIAGMAPAGVRLTLAHLDRAGDMTRDEAIRWAELAPKWLGVSISREGMREKGAALKQRTRKRDD